MSGETIHYSLLTIRYLPIKLHQPFLFSYTTNSNKNVCIEQKHARSKCEKYALDFRAGFRFIVLDAGRAEHSHKRLQMWRSRL
ncbi:hypothetical protein BH24ACI2_BH24ACI2_07690 [soil metagenome]